MAFYTTYTTVVPFNTSVVITKAATSNAVADMLVNHGGCTLVGHATEGVASGVTNYAEITYGGMYIRFYDAATAPTSLGGMAWYIATTPGGTAINSGSISFSYAAGVSVTVSMLFYNTLSGFVVKTANGNYILYGISLEKLSDGSTAYAIGPTVPLTNQAAYINDGLIANGQYWCISTDYIGPYHADNAKQLLHNTFLVTTSSGHLTRYRINNVYACFSYLETNIVEVDGRYFYIVASGYAIELNP